MAVALLDYLFVSSISSIHMATSGVSIKSISIRALIIVSLYHLHHTVCNITCNLVILFSLTFNTPTLISSTGLTKLMMLLLKRPSFKSSTLICSNLIAFKLFINFIFNFGEYRLSSFLFTCKTIFHLELFSNEI